MKYILFFIAFAFSLSMEVHAEEFLGILNGSPYDPNSVNNPYGAGNPYKPNGINNLYGPFGNPYSNRSTTNPNATNAPKIYDQDGNYRGRLSRNPYDPDSISNPYGRYGNPYSPDSIKNPYGTGNPYLSNQFSIIGEKE